MDRHLPNLDIEDEKLVRDLAAQSPAADRESEPAPPPRSPVPH
jgi:hypothetical protein